MAERRWGNGTDPMRQINTSRDAYAMPAELTGQRCDRLRPGQVLRELEQALGRSAVEGCTLVEWQWNQRQGRVQGWLWQRGLLQSFCWWRQSGRLTLRQQLQCTTTAPLQA